MSKRQFVLLPAMLLLIVSAFVLGFLRGYTWGIEYALNGMKLLRRYAECKGEQGAEWAYGSPHPKAGQRLEDNFRDRHAIPFAEVPTWLGNFAPLNRIEYDLAEPLHHNRASVRSDSQGD